MLALYGKAIGRMKALPRHDPRNWYFQSNIHGYPEGRPVNGRRSAEMQQIINSLPQEERTRWIFSPDRGRTAEEKAQVARNRALGAWTTGPTWRLAFLLAFPSPLQSRHGRQPREPFPVVAPHVPAFLRAGRGQRARSVRSPVRPALLGLSAPQSSSVLDQLALPHGIRQRNTGRMAPKTTCTLRRATTTSSLAGYHRTRWTRASSYGWTTC